MYLCLCHAVTTNEVNASIALGAGSVAEVGQSSAAGTGCGSCQVKIEGLLEAAALRRERGCCGSGCGAFCLPMTRTAGAARAV